MTIQSPFSSAVTPDGDIEIDVMANALHVTRLELASAAGLSRDAVTKTARKNSRSTQARLRDIFEIIRRVQGWAGSAAQAYAWYRAQPLPSFGDRTAEDLVKDGKAEAVKTYLSRIAVGGHA